MKRLILLLLLLLNTIVWAHTGNYKFKRLSVADGLSGSQITGINQDHQGFLWIGTADGLNRYDGYRFKVYKKDADNPNSLVHNSIFSVFVASNGNLWVGTHRGISRYIGHSDSFENYLLNDQDLHTNRANHVDAFAEDSEHNLFTCAEDGFIYKFDYTLNKFSLVDTIQFGTIRAMIIDRDDQLWIGSDSSVFRYDWRNKIVEQLNLQISRNRTYERYYVQTLCEDGDDIWIGMISGGTVIYNKKNKTFRQLKFNYYKENDVDCIFKENDHEIWIATKGGLKLYDKSTKTFKTFRYNKFDPFTISDDSICEIFKDEQGDLWFGTLLAGINLLVNNKQFHHFREDAYQAGGLTKPIVSALWEDIDENLWAGFFTDGIDVINRKTGKKRFYFYDPQKPGSLGASSVLCIYQDSFGIIWVGTYLGGLQKFDPVTHTFTAYKHDPQNPTSIGSNDVRSIIEDQDHNLWLVTQGAGISRFDRKTGHFIHYRADYSNLANSLLDDWPFMLLLDSRQQIWVATPTGLSCLGKDRTTFTNFQSEEGNENSLCNDFINYLFEDSDKNLWIGTIEGLNLYNPATNTFKRYTVKDGLPNAMINGILEDDHKNLWISTNGGLSKFSPSTNTFRNYDVADGLQSNEFLARSCFKNKHGEMFFGGVNGITVFYPDSIRDNPYIPPVVITDFRLFNESIPMSNFFKEKTTRTDSNDVQPTISLKHHQNVFEFEFVALNFHQSEKNQFSYMMQGFDKEWIASGNKREATYTNLNPGDYVFRVIASNNDGIWNMKGVALPVKILPPFWETIPFRIFGILFFIALVLTFIKIRTNNIKQQNVILEGVNQQLKTEIGERIRAENKIKDSLMEKEVLLRELHHRVKNNLQIIRSLITLQSKHINDKKALAAFDDISKRIFSMALVHEKMYKSNNFVDINFREYIESMVRELFYSYEITGNIELDLSIQDISLGLDVAIPCGLVINELVTNSLKHAFPNGKKGLLQIHLQKQDDHSIQLSVSDNGKGIAPDIDPHNPNTLGLTLVKILTQQLNGNLEIRNNNGSEFLINFKCNI
ncbi:MAG TPA: two-component regulator propeller domain-containing protein [bacterium]|nr:two-component regulator propeller domain-containing protein [bacterium]HPN43338.1 two-component regulator propeller domain-containing protein [bacterium]